jgi:pyruvate dehydrogenase E1 component alpha subunit
MLSVPYQILREDGSVVDEALLPKLSDDELIRLYREMLRLRTLDDRMLTLQRQGRISFYGAAQGQEAAVMGSALAMQSQDFVMPALREAGILLFRGFPLQSYIDQLVGNVRDVSQGRQMPCHPPGGPYRYVTMSSCIGNQIPQVPGLAYGAKMANKGEVVFGFMGEGATSQGDFHVGLNFAAVMHVPAVFICQNNQWSISVPWEKQSAERSVAKKGAAYNIEGITADGNDALACYTAVKAAADKARSGGGPTLVELLTYRVGAHTTSDDPSRYRDESVTQMWKTQRDPVKRMKAFLQERKLWSDEQDEQEIRQLVESIKAAVSDAEAQPQPPLESIVTDTFQDLPWHLQEQLDELKR